MYYAHMRKEDILSSSRPFLYEIYKKWADRACENLGVSPKKDSNDNCELTEDDYPKEFVKISDRDMRQSVDNLLQNDEFMKAFPDFANRYK